MVGKKNDVNILTKNSTVEIVNVENLQNANSIEMHELAENFENSSTHDISGKEGTSGDMIVSPVIMKENDPSTLVLHNAFELLEADSALPSGKARLPDMDISTSLKDGCFEKIAHFEVPSEKRPIQFVASSSSNQLLKDVSGLQSCTMPAAVSPGQTLAPKSVEHVEKVHVLSPVELVTPCETQPTLSSNAATIPSVEILKEKWGDLASDSDEQFLAHVSGCAMPQPITTYHTSLSGDKLPVLMPPVHTAVVCSSEAQRSVDILQKFWGDYTNDEHEHESSLVCPSAARIKKQKKQTNRQVSPISTSSEHIQTRSKKGVIKSNPKYCD